MVVLTHFFCCLRESIILYSLLTSEAPKTRSPLAPRDDAGQFDTNHIGPKKRPAYETGSERRFERVANTAISAVKMGRWASMLSWMYCEPTLKLEPLGY